MNKDILVIKLIGFLSLSLITIKKKLDCLASRLKKTIRKLNQYSQFSFLYFFFSIPLSFLLIFPYYCSVNMSINIIKTYDNRGGGGGEKKKEKNKIITGAVRVPPLPPCFSAVKGSPFLSYTTLMESMQRS